ncbi:type II toxin-antitoxin system VapC family toxin [Rubrimonas cliftonensis]|nr:type II toxin-antitoxin system VapC family toxin [Rubrimonas cliftonensis]
MARQRESLRARRAVARAARYGVRHDRHHPRRPRSRRRVEVVVDASVAVKWLIPEHGSVRAASLRTEELFAPRLIRAEVANTLATLERRGEFSATAAAEAFALFQDAPLRITETDEDLERAALAMAIRLRHPVHDCSYLSLAERVDATLVTADRRFVATLVGDVAAARAAAL